MNKQTNNKKMLPEKPGIGNEDPQNKNQSLIFIGYGAWFLSLITFTLFRNANSSGVETFQQSFYEMVKQGDVKLITVIRNKDIVRVSINPDSLKAKSSFTVIS